MRASHVMAMAMVLALAVAACKQDPLAEVHRRDSGVTDGPGNETGPGDGGLHDGVYKDACVPDPKGEVCDGLDNDCNGKVDDVPATELTSTKNCGKCGNACSFPGGFARCQGGKCVLEGCAPGYWDINKDASDGCEYVCLPSNGGAEICDGIDNDCDGVTDDGFDFAKDPLHCGSCGTVCPTSHTTSSCVGGKCQIDACDQGWVDANKDVKDGCEYQCPVWPPLTSDPCDGVDNDCDGSIDEDFVASSACYTHGSGCDVKTGVCKGECKLGVASCPSGYLFCQGEQGPKGEVCDEKDNDCDGVVDNGFDKQNDPRYCGGCTACALDHAIAKCVAGVCAVAVCELGWVDLDKNPGNGCEYQCTPTGAEICDGIDNDCNGLVDTKDPGMAQLGANPCASLGACAGATASCQGASGWVCSYGPEVELKKCSGPGDCGGGPCASGLCTGVVAAQETICDGKDNNCNGLVDEAFPDKGKPCAEAGKKGICQGKGTYICNSTGTAAVCDLTTPGQSPKDEECNGLDDDCDGLIDEEATDSAGKGVTDSMVHVSRTVAGKPYDFYIYAYEASRPDATASSAGVAGSRACSKPGVLPWASVTYTEAASACAASGKRLCSGEEWEVACGGAAATLYPYGVTYQAHACNGLDHAVGAPVPVGSMATCAGGEPGLFDMSGNLREWTSEQAGSTGPPDNKPIYVVRGGAYHTPAPGLTCNFSFSLAVVDLALPAIGFRCCWDGPP